MRNKKKKTPKKKLVFGVEFEARPQLNQANLIKLLVKKVNYKNLEVLF